jgi:hypothetical protein
MKLYVVCLHKLGKGVRDDESIPLSKGETLINTVVIIAFSPMSKQLDILRGLKFLTHDFEE